MPFNGAAASRGAMGSVKLRDGKGKFNIIVIQRFSNQLYILSTLTLELADRRGWER